MKRLFSNKKTVHHQSMIRTIVVRPVLTALCCSMMFITIGCKSDKVGTNRIINIPVKAEENKTDVNIDVSLQINNATLSVYDISNDTAVFAAQINTPVPKADTASVPQTISLDTKNIPKNAALLVSISADGNSAARYYDISLEKNIPIPLHKPLLALSTTNSIRQLGNLEPTPITTLALYRALAKIGWFYEHNELPSPSELSVVLKEQPSLLRLYKFALLELENTFKLKSIDFEVLLTTQELLKQLKEVTDNGYLPRTTESWLVTIATLNTYNKVLNSSAPYFTFAHDLAKDFYDGDIDGATLNGLGNISSNNTSDPRKHLVDKPLVNYTENKISDNNTVVKDSNPLFERQKSNISAYNKKFYTQLTKLVTHLIKQSSSDKQKVISKKLNSILERYEKSDVFQGSELIHSSYFGIGNKTKAFGLADNTSRLDNINLDDRLSFPLDAISLIGKYSGTDCQLTINANGVVTMQANGNFYKTYIDREMSDSINRITDGSENYMLNIATEDNNTKKRRFIQVEIHNQQPISVSTSLTDKADRTKLLNPEASCSFI